MARMVSCGRPSSCFQTVRVYCVRLLAGFKAAAGGGRIERRAARTTTADRRRRNMLAIQFQYKPAERINPPNERLIAPPIGFAAMMSFSMTADFKIPKPAKCGRLGI